MSWSDSPALSMPFISYEIDIVRNLFTNGSSTIDATAIATVGKLSHGDAVSSLFIFTSSSLCYELK